MEYSKQLLLSCLLNICHKLCPDGRPPATGRLQDTDTAPGGLEENFIYCCS